MFNLNFFNTNKVNINMERVLKIIYQVALGMIGGLIVIILHVTDFEKPRIATVNITGIVNDFIKSQAALSLSKEELRQRVKVFGNKLENTLQNISQKKHLILMPTEAVIVGSSDLTGEVENQLPNGNK